MANSKIFVPSTKAPPAPKQRKTVSASAKAPTTRMMSTDARPSASGGRTKAAKTTAVKPPFKGPGG